jgi:hypothetical protein
MVSPGEFVQMSGAWVNDRTHGQQFRARFLKASPPTTLEGIGVSLGIPGSSGADRFRADFATGAGFAGAGFGCNSRRVRRSEAAKYSRRFKSLEAVRSRIVELALEEPELSPREIAVRFIDREPHTCRRHREPMLLAAAACALPPAGTVKSVKST